MTTGGHQRRVPNDTTCTELANSIALLFARPRPSALHSPDQRCLRSALFD